MPGPKRPRREPTDDWEQLRLFVGSRSRKRTSCYGPSRASGRHPGRARATGAPARTLTRKADRFDAEGMASLFETRYPSPQPFLWDLAAVERHTVLCLDPYRERRRPVETGVREPLFPFDIEA